MSEAHDHDALLTKAREGDRKSLVALLEALGPRVRARIEPKIPPALRPAVDADDVMQVTYLEAVTRIEKFASGGSSAFLAWLTRLAENNLTDAIRWLEAAKRPSASRRVVAKASDDSASDFLGMLGVHTATPSRDAARGEAARWLDAALASLPGDYEKVVRLYDLEGRSPQEVAEAMGRSPGAMWMLRARAHERLKEAMGPAGRFFSQPG
ncbi:MAG: sigma-70 family RNA polymerase sigma factor [Phycisphaerae bacterium]|nr:sigma-70 family RNA polymerase sigma factor [Phycisphaerae bacterium]